MSPKTRPSFMVAQVWRHASPGVHRWEHQMPAVHGGLSDLGWARMVAGFRH